MAGPDPLKRRIEILQMAEAQGKALKPEHLAELESYRKSGLAKGGEDNGKPMPLGFATPYEKQIGLYGGLAQSGSSFKDDFGGNVAGNLENKLQSMVGSVGTPGQRDWWAQFRSNDNQIRNDLFGATLTPGETASYTATTISEDMDPAEIRRNLKTRKDIVAKALGRKTKFLKAQGYSHESIEGLAGEYMTDFDPPPGTAVIPPKLDERGAPAVSGGTSNPLPGAGPNGTGTEVVGHADALHRVIDDAAGVTPSGPMRVDIKPTADARLNDPKFKAGLQALLDDPKATGDQIRAYWSEHGGMPKNADAKGVPTSVERTGAGIGETIDSAMRGAADTVTLGFSDELSAAGKTVFGDGTMKDNLAAERATNRFDDDFHPIARTTGQVAGGFALPMGGARTAVALGAKGAAYGAGYGFGSADGNIADRFKGAALGGIAGGVTGAALGAGGNALAARYGRASNPAPGPTEGQALLAAADRQGIQPMAADVGGAMSRRLTGAAGQSPVSSAPIVAGARRVVDQGQAARTRIADAVGTSVEPEAAGQAAQAGAQAFIARTRGVANGAYTRAERLAGDTRINPASARQNLDQHIADLGQTPGGADGLAALTDLRVSLDGDFTVAGIRNMRTTLRDRFIGQGLRGSDLERRVNQVVDAANEDVVRGLNTAGRPEAARAFAVADRYYRNRLRTIDETLAPIIGKDGEKSGEEVVKSLQAAAKGNAARLTRFVGALPADESATVRATLISQLGRSSDGAQNAAGGAFSLGQFLTHWNQMTPGAKRGLFGAETQAALNDLAMVAQGSKAAATYTNHSNTTGGIVGNLVLSGGIGAGLGLKTMGASLATQYGAGRLLASPRFARWVAGAPRATNAADYIGRLGTIASREPAIAQEVLGLQQRLVDAASRSTNRVAAEEPDPTGGKVPK